ncbi:anti-sigma factor, partial [Bacillus thuringiensis]|nr:anti-sigma factor [Bacillus thuringiensis]
FYNIGSLLPGQTLIVKLGYLGVEDKLVSIFLDAFRYSGFSGTENMHSKNRWWFDIRQY